MKKAIITILLAIATSMTAIAQSPSTFPMWERKSAPAVILGRYVDWKRGDNPYPSYLGNHESLKGGDFPECVIDSINGTFTLTWDICYPLRHRFMNGLTILLFPGDTVRLDVDRGAFAKYETYNKKAPGDSITTPKLRELWQKAFHVEGATVELPRPIKMKEINLSYNREFATAHYRDTYDEWREVCWNEFQEVVKQLDSLDLTAQEREYQRMAIEQRYLHKLKDYSFTKRIWDLTKDKDSLAMFEQQMTFKDPHAPELTYYRNVTGFYACLNNLYDEGRLYIQANGLDDSPLGRWFKELDGQKTKSTPCRQSSKGKSARCWNNSNRNPPRAKVCDATCPRVSLSSGYRKSLPSTRVTPSSSTSGPHGAVLVGGAWKRWRA